MTACMSPQDTELWEAAELVARRGMGNSGARTHPPTSPCDDCCEAFALEMRAAVPSRCDGKYPGEVRRRNRHLSDEEWRQARRAQDRARWHRRKLARA